MDSCVDDQVLGWEVDEQVDVALASVGQGDDVVLLGAAGQRHGDMPARAHLSAPPAPDR